MLTDMGTILRQAKKEGYGVAAPNAWSLNTVKSIFEAASELKAPIIIDGAGIHQIEEVSDAVHFYEKKFPEVTAALNLDHGGPFEEIIQAIRCGYTSVMVDRSTLTFEENVREVAEIVKIAHAHNMLVLVDEAHGTHLYFGENLPVCAMDAGADMASVSMHKSGGSLTQSSLLLTGKNVNWEYVSQIINLTQTTSASYLLMSSLDISRRNLALRGKESFAKVSRMAEYAREEINAIGGFYAYGKDMINGSSVYDFDVTKLSVYTRDIGLAGIEVYDLLRDEYDIQIELGDIANILAYISIGDRIQDIERLVGALSDIQRLYARDPEQMPNTEYINPTVMVSPQTAFYAEKKAVPIRETEGMICGEFAMCYPPGIPILAPGEMITKEIIDYIIYAKEKGCSMQGTQDPAVEYLYVMEAPTGAVRR